ncbi:MAG TPA: acyl-CoA carboxylase epsilon subunit [Actinocrinis sp.]|jgi:hypothetical protein|nr:acyl-CoA carboxylase epsilon subunit [Actinocrinis sp.]
MTQSSDNPGIPAAEVRILRGNPTDEEIAALLAVVAALGASRKVTEPVQHVRRPRLRRRHGHHRPAHRSAGSWRRHQ